MAFPSTYLDVVVQVALGADPTADPSDWAWTDATALGLIRATAPITITHGGYDGSIQSPPGTCTFVADNLDGRWVPTNPTGAWYGQISKGTPVRVVVDEGTPSVRFTGFLTSLPPRWNTKETDRYVTVTASGIFQRLQRGQTPFRSALVQEIGSSGPVAYWPGEDASGSTFIAEFFGGKPMKLTGQVVTLASDGPDGSSPLPEFTTVSGTNGVLPTRSATTGWTIACVINFPASPTAKTILVKWNTSGSLPDWYLTLSPATPDTLNLEAYDTAGVQQINDSIDFVTTSTSEVIGQWVIISAAAEQNGTSIDWSYSVQDENGGSGQTGTQASTTVGQVTRIAQHANSKSDGMLAGHWVVWDEYGDFTPLIAPAALIGHAGEYVSTRVLRLGQDSLGVETDEQMLLAMGPQSQDTFLANLRECEAVSGGRLYENLDPTTFNALLQMKFATDLENQTAALTLNHDSGHLAPPFDPTDDDQQLRNDWTATRAGASVTGSSARVIATEGEHSSLTPENVGRYDDSVTVNVELDEQLVHQAGWRVAVGAVEGLRFPVVSINFARAPSLIPSWIGCDIGSRITITNPPEGIAPDSIDLFIEGWTEVLGPKTWDVQLNCSPYKPWHVFRLAETSSDTNAFLGRLAADPECALRIAISSSDTSWVVDPNFYRWTQTADDFPLSVRIGGEVATLSSIANGAGSFVAAGAASHADNAAVTPALYTGHSARQIIFVLAAIRSSGTGILATPTDYTRLPIFPDGANVQVFAKIHDGSEAAPTVTPSGGSAGDTVSAFTFGWTNMSNTLDSLTDIVVENVAMLNASAQNINYGGVLTRIVPSVKFIFGWKQDDYTSVAVPTGFTEILEASSTTGNDQSLYAAYREDTTGAVVVEGSLAVTGGASAISRSAVCAIPAGVQSFTVSARHVNGVTKAHSVGARIEVEDPSVLAL